jgi:hypothetical protein
MAPPRKPEGAALSVLVAAKVLPIDAARIARLAASRRMKPAVLARELLRIGLDHAESDIGPPVTAARPG